MRRETIITGLLCLNLVLAAALAFVWRHRPAGVHPAQAPIPSAAPVVAGGTRSIGPSSQVPSPAPSVFSWHALESPDYKQYIANLRAVGCPAQTIQDIIVAAVNKQYAARELALNLRPEQAKPWEVAAWSGPGLYEKQRQMRELVREKRALLKELLGLDVALEVPAFYANPQTEKFEAAFVALPEAKRDQVRRIQEDFWDKSDALEQRTHGFWEPEDLAERKRLQKERREAMAQVLAPDELDNYELATSATGSAVRAELAAFAPTAKELRDIFRLRQQLDEDLDSDAIGFAPEERLGNLQRAEAYRQLDQQIKSLLGDQRYAEYQRAQDSSFRNLSSIAQENDLPKDTAIKAYEAQKLARQEVTKIRSAPDLSPEQRQESLKAMQAELDKTLAQLLGDRGFQTYQRNPGSRLYYERRGRVVTTPPAPQ